MAVQKNYPPQFDPFGLEDFDLGDFELAPEPRNNQTVPQRPPAAAKPPQKPPVATKPPQRPPVATKPPQRPPVATKPPQRPPVAAKPPESPAPKTLKEHVLSEEYVISLISCLGFIVLACLGVWGAYFVGTWIGLPMLGEWVKLLVFVGIVAFIIAVGVMLAVESALKSDKWRTEWTQENGHGIVSFCGGVTWLGLMLCAVGFKYSYVFSDRDMPQSMEEPSPVVQLPLPEPPPTATMLPSNIDEIQRQIKPAHEIWLEYEKLRNDRN